MLTVSTQSQGLPHLPQTAARSPLSYPIASQSREATADRPSSVISKPASVELNSGNSRTPVPPTLVVLDSGLEAVELLSMGLEEGVDALMLAGDRDGIEQVTEQLQQQGRVERLVLVTHGSPGVLMLGHTVLSQSALERYRQHWSLYGSTADLCL